MQRSSAMGVQKKEGNVTTDVLEQENKVVARESLTTRARCRSIDRNGHGASARGERAGNGTWRPHHPPSASQFRRPGITDSGIKIKPDKGKNRVTHKIHEKRRKMRSRRPTGFTRGTGRPGYF